MTGPNLDDVMPEPPVRSGRSGEGGDDGRLSRRPRSGFGVFSRGDAARSWSRSLVRYGPDHAAKSYSRKITQGDQFANSVVMDASPAREPAATPAADWVRAAAMRGWTRTR